MEANYSYYYLLFVYLTSRSNMYVRLYTRYGDSVDSINSLKDIKTIDWHLSITSRLCFL